MSETEQQVVETQPIDPPENQGGGDAMAVEGGTEIKPVDPPEGNGSGGNG